MKPAQSTTHNMTEGPIRQSILRFALPILLGLLAALVLTAFGVLFSPAILRMMNTPAEILPDSSAYLQIYFGGVIGLIMYNVFASILQSVGNSRHPLYYLILSSVTNIVLDVIFIRGLGWGVWSAAFATVLSQILSAALCFFQLLRTCAPYRICLRELKLQPQTAREILKYGLPTGFQNCVIGLSNVLIQSQINVFGEVVVAGCGAFQKIEGFGLLPITSFTLALTTYVGQNAGAGKDRRVRDGARFGLLFSMILAEISGIVIFIFAPVLIRGFNASSQVILAGTRYARTVTLFYFLPAFTHDMAAVFRGKGKPGLAMTVILVCWCIARILFLLTMVSRFSDVRIIYWAYPLTWIFSSVTFFVLDHLPAQKTV